MPNWTWYPSYYLLSVDDFNPQPLWDYEHDNISTISHSDTTVSDSGEVNRRLNLGLQHQPTHVAPGSGCFEQQAEKSNTLTRSNHVLCLPLTSPVYCPPSCFTLCSDSCLACREWAKGESEQRQPISSPQCHCPMQAMAVEGKAAGCRNPFLIAPFPGQESERHCFTAQTPSGSPSSFLKTGWARMDRNRRGLSLSLPACSAYFENTGRGAKRRACSTGGCKRGGWGIPGLLQNHNSSTCLPGCWVGGSEQGLPLLLFACSTQPKLKKLGGQRERGNRMRGRGIWAHSCNWKKTGVENMNMVVRCHISIGRNCGSLSNHLHYQPLVLRSVTGPCPTKSPPAKPIPDPFVLVGIVAPKKPLGKGEGLVSTDYTCPCPLAKSICICSFGYEAQLYRALMHIWSST